MTSVICHLSPVAGQLHAKVVVAAAAVAQTPYLSNIPFMVWWVCVYVECVGTEEAIPTNHNQSNISCGELECHILVPFTIRHHACPCRSLNRP